MYGAMRYPHPGRAIYAAFFVAISLTAAES